MRGEDRGFGEQLYRGRGRFVRAAALGGHESGHSDEPLHVMDDILQPDFRTGAHEADAAHQLPAHLRLRASPEGKEGLAAFLEKRNPSWPKR